MQKFIVLLVALYMSSFAVNGQTVAGVWKTIDDETGEPKSHLELFEADGKLYQICLV